MRPQHSLICTLVPRTKMGATWVTLFQQTKLTQKYWTVISFAIEMDCFPRLNQPGWYKYVDYFCGSSLFAHCAMVVTPCLKPVVTLMKEFLRNERNRTEHLYIYNIYIYITSLLVIFNIKKICYLKNIYHCISPESSFGDCATGWTQPQTVPRLHNLKNGGTLWGGKEKICKMWQTGDCWYGYVSWPKSHGKVEDLRSGIQGPTTYTRAPS